MCKTPEREVGETVDSPLPKTAERVKSRNPRMGFGQTSRAALFARSGLAFHKEAQLVLWDRKFGVATPQANY